MKQTLLTRKMILPFASLMMVMFGAGWWLSLRLELVDMAAMQQQQIQSELMQVRQQISQSAQDKQWIAQYGTDYRDLQLSGFIGPDQRLAWDRELVTISSRLGLSAVTFDISPQQPHKPDLVTGGLKLMDTPVSFAADIPHEGVFARLIESLKDQGPGIFTLRECSLTHADETMPLHMQCLFVWHTLLEQGGST